jgi:hypothetical protein
MVLFIGTSYCSRYWRDSRKADLNAQWSLYNDMQAQFGWLGRYSPAEGLRAPLRAKYEKAGAQAMDDSDWAKAELCLGRAMDLGSGRDIAGKLVLAEGYEALQRGRHDNARDRFLEAARDMPESPDPHLGLARADMRASLPGEEIAEFGIAERLGYRLGAREMEQRAEAHRLRGFEELQAGNVTAARQDLAWGGPPGLRGASRTRSSRNIRTRTGRRGR